MQALIRGTPGIGKSVFLTFLLWSLIQQHRGKDVSIVYHHGPTNSLAVMNLSSKDVQCYDTAKAPPNDAVLRIVKKPNNWVLLDSCSHIGDPNSVAHTVMVTSPRAQLYNEFKKYAVKLWMPVWEWTELADCRLKVFDDTIKLERLKSVAEICGPIPRLVFDAQEPDLKDYIQTLQMDVKEAIPKDLHS